MLQSITYIGTLVCAKHTPTEYCTYVSTVATYMQVYECAVQFV